MLIVNLFSEIRSKFRMENMLSGLERMVVYDLIVVLKHLTKKDKMSLRASSTTMLRRINELENTFKVWRIYTGDFINLRKMADDICYIQGIKYFAIFQPSSKLSWGGGLLIIFVVLVKHTL